MADDADNKDNTDDAEQADKEKAEKAEARMTALAEAVQTLAGSVQGMQSNMQQMAEQIGRQIAARDDVKEIQVDMDLEKLDRKDFAAYITSQIMDRIQAEIVKPIKDEVGGITTHLGRNSIETQVRETAAVKLDFMEWKTEITDTLKANPKLTVRQAYALVREEFPDKAKKMDEKYMPKVKKETPAFLGLMPSSSRTVSTSKMTATDAAEAAWESVMGSLPSDARVQ
jgi:hypothetical protein